MLCFRLFLADAERPLRIAPRLRFPLAASNAEAAALTAAESLSSSSPPELELEFPPLGERIARNWLMVDGGGGGGDS